ncbi:hypothetical protein A1O3_08912 [Capronia epimyces CBS 606.96]|uniref:Uncharacterized protein n=1 Tax=Capronia epimyces CBS 606.96 TaxID=1182542 RepID=W9XQ28_9EURO|nr:uncharacterized protein A1O3_08912 [Capronia epimyces CBS 606.96]EXJ79410.1 hypothetical protein A1O3_08912 [Capronia epimyces CBS 606.96]
MKVNKNVFRVNSPLNQNIVMGCILFCLPGIYVALTGLGAGGGRPSSASVANETNAILYGLFALCAWLAGTVINLLGPRISIVIGSIGYPLYIGGLWYFDRTGHSWFPLWGGAMLGILCGILLTAAAFIQFAYPEEKDKGLFISMQFMMKASGAFVGALIAFCANVHEKKAVGVSTAVYSVFIAIQTSSILLAVFFITDPKKVVRNDGRHIAIFKAPTLVDGLKDLGKAFLDKRLLILFPAMLVCEMPLAMVSTINAFYFNLRTRSLNNMCFQFIQILMPYLLIYVLDSKRIASRRRRGAIGVVIMGTLAIGACIGLYIWLDVVHYADIKTSPAVDWQDSHFPGIFVIYILFGAIFAGFQVVVEWILSALTNEPSTLAQFAGMVKGTSSLGMCISFVVAAQKVPTVGQLSLQFSLYVLGIAGLFWVLFFHVKETNYFIEETVIVPRHVEEETMGKLGTDQQREAEYIKEHIATQQAAAGVTSLEEDNVEMQTSTIAQK